MDACVRLEPRHPPARAPHPRRTPEANQDLPTQPPKAGLLMVEILLTTTRV